MEDQELKSIWKAYDNKLEKLLTVNMQMLEALQMQKAQSKLKKLMLSKFALVIFGALWLAVLAYGIVWCWPRIWLVMSIIGVFIINAIVIAIYLKQAIWIDHINNTESVLDSQRKLAKLQASQIKANAIMMLQFPFFSTFYINNSMFTHPNWALWLLQIAVTVGLTWLSIWLYRNMKYENMKKKWMCYFMYGSGWATGQQAAKFLIDIEEFKTENYA